MVTATEGPSPLIHGSDLMMVPPNEPGNPGTAAEAERGLANNTIANRKAKNFEFACIYTV